MYDSRDKETADKIEVLISTASAALLKVRTETGYFPYDFEADKDYPANTEQGSAGRSVPCAYALYRAGQVSTSDLGKVVDNFFKDRGLIIRAFEDYKDGDSSVFHQYEKAQNAPYYYFFDHYYAALALNELGPLKAKYVRELGNAVWRMQETPYSRVGAKDGAFYDSEFAGRSYGTAAALLILDTLSPLRLK